MIIWTLVFGALSLWTFCRSFPSLSFEVRALSILLLGQYALSSFVVLFSVDHTALYPLSDAICGYLTVRLWMRHPSGFLLLMICMFMAAGMAHVWFFDAAGPVGHQTYDAVLNGLYVVQTGILAIKASTPPPVAESLLSVPNRQHTKGIGFEADISGSGASGGDLQLCPGPRGAE